MAWLGVVLALMIIAVVFVDAFEAVILPRRVRHRYRLSQVFYRAGWRFWRAVVPLLPAGRWRGGFLSIFGPLSLFGLIALWALGLIIGFATLHWSLETALLIPANTGHEFATYLYFSGTTFFTLGFGDIVSLDPLGRALSVTEAGVGFGFLAVIISYLPVLYQAFSRREITISLLDARAGSPPTAGEFLRRSAAASSLKNLGPILSEWERWAAELLESNLSFPVLLYYRSQHDNQSWLAALSMILDTSALLITALDGPDGYQARLTFAMARHAAVDLLLVSARPTLPPASDRLPVGDLGRLRQMLLDAGLPLEDEGKQQNSLTELRGLYEPFVNALNVYLQFTLPPFLPATPPVDNWQTSPGMRSPGLSDLQATGAADEHAS